MTLAGTMNKTVLLFLLLIASAMVWWMAFNANPLVPAIGGAIAGLVIVVIAAFKPQYSLAPGYALFEGLFIGGVCHFELNILVCDSSGRCNIHALRLAGAI
jgi:uncharacterized YccA/Bax inhibitor family protein